MSKSPRRIQDERRVVAHRLKSNVIFGVGDKVRRQPHRLAKTKVKFMQQSDSLKKDKRLANRAARKLAKQKLVSRHEETPEPPRSSVRYDYW